MARQFKMFFIGAILASTLHCSVAQRTHVVGDSGWLIPRGAGGSAAYTTWASRQTFAVGDVLVFNFASGAHDVAVMTSKAAYDSCNTSATATPPITAAPAKISLTNPGQHFYICTFPRHCSLGQKLAINVTGTASTPSQAPSPSPASPTTRRPPPSITPAPSSSGATPEPSGSTITASAPSSDGVSAPPPPPNSAPSFAVAALPFTFLAIALAFFY